MTAALGARFDLVGKYAMVKGLPWSLAFTRKAGAAKTPVDLTGYSARLVVVDLLAAAAPETLPPEFSTASGHITLGDEDGTVTIALDEEDTALDYERASYRLYMTDSLGVETLLLRGRLALVEEDEWPN